MADFQLNTNIPMQYQYGPSALEQAGQVMSLADMMDRRKMMNLQYQQAAQKEQAQQVGAKAYQQQLDEYNAPVTSMPATFYDKARTALQSIGTPVSVGTTVSGGMKVIPPTINPTPQYSGGPLMSDQGQAALDSIGGQAALDSIGATVSGGTPAIPPTINPTPQYSGGPLMSDQGQAAVKPVINIPEWDQFLASPTGTQMVAQRKEQLQAKQVPDQYKDLMSPNQYETFLKMSAIHPDMGAQYAMGLADLQYKTGQASWMQRRGLGAQTKADQALDASRGLSLSSLGLDYSDPDMAAQQLDNARPMLKMHGWSDDQIDQLKDDQTGNLYKSTVTDYQNSLAAAQVNKTQGQAQQTTAGARLSNAKADAVPDQTAMAQAKLAEQKRRDDAYISRVQALNAAGLATAANKGADKTTLMLLRSKQGFGIQNNKVDQAIHLRNLLDQDYDPVNKVYNIPKSQYTELAVGAANLIAPGGAATESTIQNLQQKTAAGDFNGAISYVTGLPQTASTSDVYNILSKTVNNQGMQSESLRDNYLSQVGKNPGDLGNSYYQKFAKSPQFNTEIGGVTSDLVDQYKGYYGQGGAAIRPAPQAKPAIKGPGRVLQYNPATGMAE